MGTNLERRPIFPRVSDWLDVPDWLDMPDWAKWFDRERFSDLIKIEETRNDDHLVVRAEMPGIDPDKDVEISVVDGLLTIKAERRDEQREEQNGRTRSEFHYGSFQRTMRVPADAKSSDVVATYKDGILTITVPAPKSDAGTITRVPVSRG